MNKSSLTFEDVFEIVRAIPPGRVSTYGAIAEVLGLKSGARWVGYAMNHAHGSPDVPAHRVVNRNGMLTGRHHFPAERDMESLLRAENIEVKDNKVIHFERLFWDPKSLSQF